MFPYSPGLNELSCALIAVVTQSRSSQTIGLELPRPGIFVRQAADAGAKVVGVGFPCEETPLASMPRNAGQSMPGRGARTAPPRCAAAMPMNTISAVAVEKVRRFSIDLLQAGARVTKPRVKDGQRRAYLANAKW